MSEKLEPKLHKGHVLVMEHFMHGENMTWVTEVDPEALAKFIHDHTCEDGAVLLEDLTVEKPIQIKLITVEAHRESCINGLIWGDGVSRKVAENIVDGIPMTDEEFERLNDEEEAT